MYTEVYEIIFQIFDMQDIQRIKNTVDILIETNTIHKKTDLFVQLLETQNASYIDLKEKCKMSINNLTSVICTKIYFDAILSINNDIVNFSHIYTICKMSNNINEQLHSYIKTMVKINMLLEEYIIFLFNNMNINDIEYFPIIKEKIENILKEYKDDNTNWNVI